MDSARRPIIRTHLILLALPLCCSLLATALLMGRGPVPDPVYERKALSEWLATWGHRNGNTPFPLEREKAAGAIGHLGSNALPSLLAWMAYDPPISRYRLICDRLPRKVLLSYPLYKVLVDPQKEERAANAAAALSLIAPQAASAVPELNSRARRGGPQARDRAIFALSWLGEPAVSPMANLLSNDAISVPYLTACLLNLRTNAAPLIPILIQKLTHTNEPTAVATAQTLARLRLAPHFVVPALTNSLQDPRPYVRMAAACALDSFGELAHESLPSLTNALTDPDPDVRATAFRTLTILAPEPLTNTPTR